MKKLSISNYLLTAFFVLLIVGVIYLSIVSGSVKYFGYFVLTLAVLFTIGNAMQHHDHTNARNFRSRSREQILRDQFRK